jgi:hypothetical protein
LLILKIGAVGGGAPTPIQKRCGGDSHRQDKTAKFPNLVKVTIFKKVKKVLKNP